MSFSNITSTEQALNLLRQFQSALKRESLAKDLNDKYAVIFQNYALDLVRNFPNHHVPPP
jgi:dynein heavy chain